MHGDSIYHTTDDQSKSITIKDISADGKPMAPIADAIQVNVYDGEQKTTNSINLSRSQAIALTIDLAYFTHHIWLGDPPKRG